MREDDKISQARYYMTDAQNAGVGVPWGEKQMNNELAWLWATASTALLGVVCLLILAVLQH